MAKYPVSIRLKADIKSMSAACGLLAVLRLIPLEITTHVAKMSFITHCVGFSSVMYSKYFYNKNLLQQMNIVPI